MRSESYRHNTCLTAEQTREFAAYSNTPHNSVVPIMSHFMYHFYLFRDGDDLIVQKQVSSNQKGLKDLLVDLLP